MLINAKKLIGYGLNCVDGEIGHVKDFYFDDRYWAIRYLVADSGTWLPGRQVLISPHALGDAITKEHNITVDLTKQQIENSPSLETDKPLTRQFEKDYYTYFGWGPYWGGPLMWGYSPYIFRNGAEPMHEEEAGKEWDPDLQSTNDVRGYDVHASNGGLGHIDDFVIADSNWAIRYLVVDTRNWWPGKHVLISPRWIDGVSWSESLVSVNIPRETIKNAPEYKEGDLLSPEYEAELHAYYEREGHAIEAPVSKASVL